MTRWDRVAGPGVVDPGGFMLKFLGGIIGVIFLIGLLVVVGLLVLIF